MAPYYTNTEVDPLVKLSGGNGSSSSSSDYGRCDSELGPRSPPGAASTTGGVVHGTLPRA